MLRHMAAAFTAISLSACAGDPTAATEENFERAIQAKLDTKGCLELPHNTLGSRQALPIEVEGKGSELLQNLARVGALTAEPAQVLPFITFSGKRVDGTRFDVTDRGREVIRTRQIKQGSVEIAVAELCLGRMKVTGIERFTEPAERSGMKVTQVHYTYRLTDYPDWAETLVLDDDAKGKIVLAATSDGWVDARSLR